MFLSGNIIAAQGGSWIAPFEPGRVESAAYCMRIGDEAFVSPEGRDSRTSGLEQRLNRGDPIVIPPGQFAFLSTREFVRLPHDLLGFINMKSTLKNSGLVNVSGFHVDPGYKGKLLFAVFNAGPQTITVRSDQDAFLIWFARLEDATEEHARRKPGFSQIDTTLMSLMPTETASLNSLKRQIDEVRNRLAYIKSVLVLAGSLAISVAAALIGSSLLEK